MAPLTGRTVEVAHVLVHETEEASRIGVRKFHSGSLMIARIRSARRSASPSVMFSCAYIQSRLLMAGLMSSSAMTPGSGFGPFVPTGPNPSRSSLRIGVLQCGQKLVGMLDSGLSSDLHRCHSIDFRKARDCGVSPGKEPLHRYRGEQLALGEAELPAMQPGA